MRIAHWVVTRSIKVLTRLLCRVDDRGVPVVPERGPLILVCNHVNFLDAPLVYTHLWPRPLATLAKVETWDNRPLGLLADLWGAIPIHRGEADLTALRRALAVLDAGSILVVTPEGTRSGDGRLRRGHPGVVTLSLHSGAPLLPLALYGAEAFRRNLAHLQRTDVRIAVGRPFTLEANGARITGEVRRQMVDEIMLQIAALLPANYRGYYSYDDLPTFRYVRHCQMSNGGSTQPVT